MRLVYVLLSPTFGMHQYTAHYANMLAAHGHEVHLVTTGQAVRDRYATAVTIHTPINNRSTGLALETLRWSEMRRAFKTITVLQPDLVHFGGPHLWNVPLVLQLKRHSIPIIHTIHDLDPHTGTRFGSLLHLWNKVIMRSSDHILLHGQCYRQRLINQGTAPEKITYAPILHLFLSYQEALNLTKNPQPVQNDPFILFFGRLEKYKGIDDLLTAYTKVLASNVVNNPMRLVLAGRGQLSAPWLHQLPSGVELHNYLIEDMEAVELFRCCSLVVLPYIDATQSALVAAAYYFHKPVLVTRSGALPEYIEPGKTGFLVDTAAPDQLAEALQAAFEKPQKLVEMGVNGRHWYDTQRQKEYSTIITMYQQSTGKKPVVYPAKVLV